MVPPVQPSRRPRRPEPSAFNLADPACYDLVVSLYRRRFRFRLEQAGVAVDDGLQEVLLRLIRKSQQPSRWDPTRGALSTWLYIAIGSIVSHIITSHRAAAARNGAAAHHERAMDQVTEEEMNNGVDLKVDAERALGGGWVAEVRGFPGCTARASDKRRASRAAVAQALRVLADRVEAGEVDARPDGRLVLDL